MDVVILVLFRNGFYQNTYPGRNAYTPQEILGGIADNELLISEILVESGIERLSSARLPLSTTWTMIFLCSTAMTDNQHNPINGEIIRFSAKVIGKKSSNLLVLFSAYLF